MKKLSIKLMTLLTALTAVTPAATPPKLERGKDLIGAPELLVGKCTSVFNG